MKKNLGWITLTAVLAGAPFTLAHAEDEVPFQACKNVKLVKTKEELEVQKAKGCAAALELSTPNIGAHTATSVEALKISNMLSYVGEKQVLKDLDSRTTYWKEVKKCFDASSPSADCQKRIQSIKGAYGGFVGSLRKNLAQVGLRDNKGKFSTESELKPFGGADKLVVIPNAFPDAVLGNLQPSEAEAANADAAKQKGGLNKLKEDAQVAYTATLTDGIQKQGLYLVAYLPKPSSVSEGGAAEWSNAEWSKTVGRLIQDADKEIRATKDAIEKGSVSFPAFSTKDIVPGWDQKQRDLMFIATLTPEMEKHLAKNPQDCGTAIAAVKWMDRISYEKVGASLAAFAVGGGAAQAPKVLLTAGKFGKAAYGVAMAGGSYLGFSMLSADHANTVEKADKAFKNLAKIGVEKGKETDIVDPKKFAEAQKAADDWLTSNAIGQAVFGVAGFGAVKAAPVIAKAFVSKTKAAKEGLARLFMSSRNPEKLATELEKGVPAQYRTTLGANLASEEAGHALTLSKAVKKDLQEMEEAGTLKGDDLTQVEDVLFESHAKVAKRLEIEGKCKGNACFAKAADEEQKALREAKNACAKPAK